MFFIYTNKLINTHTNFWCVKIDTPTFTPSGSYDFFKSGSKYNYYTHANFKSRYLKTNFYGRK